MLRRLIFQYWHLKKRLPPVNSHEGSIKNHSFTHTGMRIYTHLSNGLVYGPEGRLFAVVVDPPVPVQDVDTVLFS